MIGLVRMPARCSACAAGRYRKLALCMFAVLIAATIGCSKGRDGVYPTEGQVLYNGKPIAGAQIVLYPEGPVEEGVVLPRAQTDTQGRFQLGTFDRADGARQGTYAVTVIQYPPQNQGSGWVAGPNSLPQKYASPKTTDLKVTIARGANTLSPLLLRR